MTYGKTFVQKTKRALFLCGVFFGSVILFASCATIPNEENVRRENEAIEYAKLADGYFDQKNYAKAAEYYQKAQTSEKYRDVVTYKLACSYALSSRWENARTLFDSLCALDPQNRTLRESSAYVSVMSGNITEGKRLYEALAAEYPEDASLQKNYMLVLIASGNKTDAETELNRYVSRFGKDENAYLIEEELYGKKEPTVTKDESQSDVEPFVKKDDTTEPLKEETKEDEFEIPDWTL